jgi:hypothetical protein
MELRAYYLLGTNSKRAIIKTKGRFGRPHHYSPKAPLIEKISRTLRISKQAAYQLLMKEREYLIRQQK